MELCRSWSLSHWVSVFHSLSKGWELERGEEGGESREAASCSARSGSDSRKTNSSEKGGKKRRRKPTHINQPTHPPCTLGLNQAGPCQLHSTQQAGKKSTLPGQERS